MVRAGMGRKIEQVRDDSSLGADERTALINAYRKIQQLASKG